MRDRAIIGTQVVTIFFVIVFALIGRFLMPEEVALGIGNVGHMFLYFISNLVKLAFVMNVLTGFYCMPSVPTLTSRATVLYFFFTSVLSVTIGFCFMTLLRADVTFNPESCQFDGYSALDAYERLFENLAVKPLRDAKLEITGTKQTLRPQSLTSLVFWAGLFALAMRKVPEPPQEVVHSKLDFIAKRVDFVFSFILKTLPFLLLCLSMSVFARSETSHVLNLFKFIGAVFFGLLVHGFLILPLVYVLFVRKNPFTLIKLLYKDVLFSNLLWTSRASTLELCQRKCSEIGINQETIDFMIPLGLKLSPVGTVLYEAVAVIFMAQLQNVWLNPVQLLFLGLTVMSLCIGVGEIHTRGVIVTMCVIETLGLSCYNTTILAFMEILLYPLYNTVNTIGVILGAAILPSPSPQDDRDI